MRNPVRNLFKSNPYKALEKTIGYTFHKCALLETALVHRSFKHEHADMREDNERMEFLGDSALGLITGAWLYKRHPGFDEGELTRLRSLITSAKPLTELARSIGLGAYLKLGRGEQLTGGNDRPSNLENAFEALIGAAYLDGGIAAVEKIFKKLILPVAESLLGSKWEDNPKGKLQEISQKNWHINPKYQVMGHDGPPHAKIFSVRVKLQNDVTGQGKGRTKREAESKAANDALNKLKIHR